MPASSTGDAWRAVSAPSPASPCGRGRAGGGGGGVAIPLRNVAAAIADPLGKPLPANIKTLDDALAAGLLPKGPPYGNGTGHPWQVSGYQFDIYDSPTGNIGALYEGQGRGFSANTGEVVYLTADANNNAVKTILGRTSDLTGPQYYKQGDWNQIEIIARGNTLVHMLNGKVFCVVIDDDAGRRALKGIISLQLEGTGGQRGVVPEYLAEEALKLTEDVVLPVANDARGPLQQGSHETSHSTRILLGLAGAVLGVTVMLAANSRRRRRERLPKLRPPLLHLVAQAAGAAVEGYPGQRPNRRRPWRT